MNKDQPNAPEAKKTEARRGDGMLVVSQHNDSKTLIIDRINTSAETLLGYEPGEIIGRKLETILSAKTAEMLADDVEFADDAPDLGDVLGKLREIRLRHRNGNEIQSFCSITRLMSEGMNACFQLVLPNERETLSRQKIRDFIALNLDGRKRIDEALGVPDRKTAEEFLPLLGNYLKESGISASFAVMRMDRFEKSKARYGADGCVHLLQHLSNCCRATFRSEDIVFALTDQTIGVVLFDISRESARLVLNRLRWKIRNHHIDFGGKPNFSVTATVVFDMIDEDRAGSILSRSEEAALAISADERNGLHELGVQ